MYFVQILFPFGYYKILSIVSCSIKLYLYNDTLLCHKKEWNRVTDRTWMDLEVIILTEKARCRNTNIIWYHLHVKSKKIYIYKWAYVQNRNRPVACMLSHFSWIWLCDCMDCSPLISSVCRILQVRILEWVVIPFSSRSSQPRDAVVSLMSPALAGGFFTTSATWEAQI